MVCHKCATLEEVSSARAEYIDALGCRLVFVGPIGEPLPRLEKKTATESHYDTSIDILKKMKYKLA